MSDQNLVKVSPAELKARRAARSSSGPKMTKSEWIRSMPLSMTADEVMAAAEAQGAPVSRALVYTVRGGAGAKRPPGRPRKEPKAADTRGEVARPAAVAGKRPVGRPRKVAQPSGFGPREAELAAIVLDLGLERVTELLGQLRRALDRV